MNVKQAVAKINTFKSGMGEEYESAIKAFCDK
jgi:hypothetical protein